MRRVAADIEVSSLREQLVDFLCVFSQSVLNVDLLIAFAGERSDEGECRAELSCIFLRAKSASDPGCMYSTAINR